MCAKGSLSVVAGAAALRADEEERAVSPRWSLDRTSPGTTDLVYRDVFPGAIPFELLSNKLQGRVVHRHKFRRLTILSKVIFLTTKGVKRRVRLLRTGPDSRLSPGRDRADPFWVPGLEVLARLSSGAYHAQFHPVPCRQVAAGGDEGAR